MFGGFGVGMGGMPQRFEECYHCYSVAYADKSHLEVSRVESSSSESRSRVIGQDQSMLVILDWKDALM